MEACLVGRREVAPGAGDLLPQENGPEMTEVAGQGVGDDYVEEGGGGGWVTQGGLDVALGGSAGLDTKRKEEEGCVVAR